MLCMVYLLYYYVDKLQEKKYKNNSCNTCQKNIAEIKKNNRGGHFYLYICILSLTSEVVHIYFL